MRAFVIAFFLALVFVSGARRQGADSRSWPGSEERRLGDTSAVRSKASTVITTTDSSKGTSPTPTATAITSSPAASSTTSAKTGSSPPTTGSSTYTKSGSGSSAADGNNQDGAFWDSPTAEATHHSHIDYSHPGSSA